jgi:hypothetical protein
VGNPWSYAGVEHEHEGVTIDDGAGRPAAFRTSGFKDWFAQIGPPGAGVSTYVNALTGVSAHAPAQPGAAAWRFTSPDGRVQKTITLGPRTPVLAADYAVSSPIQTLFVRFGLSPNLHDLLARGQAGLSTTTSGSFVSLANTTPSQVGEPTVVRAWVRASGASANWNPAATDRVPGWFAQPMRNQAQTQQLEFVGSGSFSLHLAFESGDEVTLDADSDGLPDWWERRFDSDPLSASGANGASFDADGDGLTALQEFIFRSHPRIANSGPQLVLTRELGGMRLAHSTHLDRLYQIEFRDDLLSGSWQPLGIVQPGTGGVLSVLDTAAPPQGRRFYRLVISVPTY